MNNSVNIIINYFNSIGGFQNFHATLFAMLPLIDRIEILSEEFKLRPVTKTIDRLILAYAKSGDRENTLKYINIGIEEGLLDEYARETDHYTSWINKGPTKIITSESAYQEISKLENSDYDKNQVNILLKFLKVSNSGSTETSPSSNKESSKNIELIYLCKHGSIELIRELLIGGADINFKSEDGINPLLMAAISRNNGICEYLLEEGANPNVQNTDGNTPLGAAIAFNNKELVKILLKKGADLNLLRSVEMDTAKAFGIDLGELMEGANNEEIMRITELINRIIESESAKFISTISNPIIFRVNLIFPFILKTKKIPFKSESYKFILSKYEDDFLKSYSNYKISWDEIIKYYHKKGFKISLFFDANSELNLGRFNFIKVEALGTLTDNPTVHKRAKNIVFLDTEVHDLKSPILIQLAYKDFDSGDSFSEYYSTGGVPISDGAMGVHHITDKMIEGKDIFETSGDRSNLQSILNEKILVAHNAKFDIGVLKSVGMDIQRSICTLKVAHYLYPNLENYKLQTLRYTFKLELEGEINPHDAMSDVLVLEKLFGKFYETLSSKLKSTDSKKIIEEMINISSRPILLDTITFGKHKGGKWSNVPKDYLDWILNKSDFRNDEDIAYTCRYHLDINDKVFSETEDENINLNPTRLDKKAKNEDGLFGNIVAITFFIGPIPSVILAFILFPENPRDNWFFIWVGLLMVSIILWVIFKKK